MIEKYKLPAAEEEMVFYLSPEIGKRKDNINSDAKFYVRKLLEKIINEYNINLNQNIGFVGDIDTIEYILVEIIEGYKKYWGFIDIDFNNPMPNN
ncbi:MAG: hypothetical protein J0I09_14465 [Sphingobacteriia bacterium]|nr:hypothetical protein [Sphingobacteriia bacterium]